MVITGTFGNDYITGSEQADTIATYSGDDNINSGNGNDTILAGDGNDTLNGGGGSDTLAGNLGDDVYVLGSNDTVIENPGEGTDVIRTGLSLFTLPTNVEFLYLSGSDDLTGYGNSVANEISGNLGNNILYGGAGNDAISGGSAGGDSVWPSPSIGFANVPSAANGHDQLYGEDGNDSLYGGAGNDLLDGGAGTDKMYGGNGNDIYYVDNVGDKTNETDSTGTDTVISTVTWTLVAGVENLTLSGGAPVNGTGNTSKNLLIGNSADNTLKGDAGNDTIVAGAGNDKIKGGVGLDILSGESGKDVFVFDSALNAATNIDTLTDFRSMDDTIQLDNDIFKAMGFVGNPASAAFFQLGAVALDANDRILYDSSTGALYYDQDGNGTKASVQFAILGDITHPTLSYADFVVIE